MDVWIICYVGNLDQSLACFSFVEGNIYKYFVILVVLLKFMLLRKGNSKVCEKLLVLQFYKYLKSASSLTAVQEINYIPSGN